MNLAIDLFLIGAGLCALASLIDTALRIPRIIARLEAERPNN